MLGRAALVFEQGNSMSSHRSFFQTSSRRTGSPVRRYCRAAIACLLAAAGLFAQLADAAEAARVVFVTGAVHADRKQLVLGQAVEEGALIATGKDGYVYLKTVDGGFLILRPDTRAKIAAYHIDRQHPENTRVKLELLGGVARSIDGAGVKQAREHFRFNTPVAAIGVRGTDFTVYTDQNTSRVAVVSGAVVVSPFVDGCRPEGGGPCSGDASRDLSASQVGQVLQVVKGQAIPQLLRDTSVAPAGAAPARPDEPSAKADASKGGAVLSPAELSLNVQKDASLQNGLQAIGIPVPPPVPAVPQPSQIIWGRWQSVLDQPANLDLTKAMNGSTRLIGINSQFALLRQKAADWQVPHEGSMGFSLQQGEAYILNEPTAALSAAKVENGQLNVDFAKSSFSTSLDLLSQTTLYKLQAQGTVSADGLLNGRSQFSPPTNMDVTGVLGAANSGTAAYLFQSRLDATHTVTGATYWANGH